MKESEKIIPTKKFMHQGISWRVTTDGETVICGTITAEMQAWKKDVQQAAQKALNKR